MNNDQQKPTPLTLEDLKEFYRQAKEMYARGLVGTQSDHLQINVKDFARFTGLQGIEIHAENYIGQNIQLSAEVDGLRIVTVAD